MFCGTLWCWTDEGGMATLWAAVITSVPALFAIFFAYRVGKNQVDIAKAAHLLEQQRVRAELYEKRSEIYGAARKFVATILMTGTVPGRNPDHELDAQIAQEFQEALGAAAFLFDDKVADLMGDIFDTSVEFHLERMLPPTLIVDRILGPSELIAKFKKLREDLAEAVRPYLTINGVGEIPKD